MDREFRHQTEDTFNFEFSTCVYNGWEYGEAAPHFHKNYELIAVKKGECRCVIAGKIYLVKEGQAVMITPFQIHEFSVIGDSEVRRITFHEHLILSLAQSLDGRKPSDPVFAPSPEVMQFFLSQMDIHFGSDSKFRSRINPSQLRMQVKGYLYMLGGEFLDKVDLIDTPSADAIVIAVAQYVSENFKSNITLRDVAKGKGYNYQYLSRTFNKVIGMSFKKMLNQYRLENAYVLLQDSDMLISEICFESGFQSVRSFNQICTDAFGKTPRELRKSRYK